MTPRQQRLTWQDRALRWAEFAHRKLCRERWYQPDGRRATGFACLGVRLYHWARRPERGR